MHGKFPQPERGAWPSVDWLREHATQTTATPEDPTPDFSLVRGEWYFTEDTASYVADRVGESLLAVGAPTVASATARQARSKHVELVDSSPWVTPRLGSRQDFTHHQADFAAYTTDLQFDTVVVDPPWYNPMLSDWIEKSAALVRPGGNLIFPMMGSGTRPGASQERERLLCMLSNLGSVRVEPEAAIYQVPRFERCALWARGVPFSGVWRKADLVEVNVTQATATRHPLRVELSPWHEYRVGESLVAIRPPNAEVAPVTSTTLLHEVSGVPNRTLDTVSRRDPRWSRINVWLSNNRVAYCIDVQRLQDTLGLIAESAHDRESNTCASAVRKSDLDELIEWIDG